MSTALVHDWLTGMRGGEKVLERLAERYPHAPIYTLVHHPGSVSEALESHPIRTSFVQRLPAPDAYRWYLPLFPLAVRDLDLRGHDLIVSSSHCVAKSVIPPSGALHLCYCHTPMRYAWDQFDAYFSRERNGAIRFALIRMVMAWLRRWDRRTADRVHEYAANSRYVAARIQRYYGREAAVLPPPVDVEEFTPSGRPPDDFWLVVSALSPYKRIDHAIRAFNRSDRPLVVVGWGPEEERLRDLAGPTVTLTGKVDQPTLVDLYRRCRGLILPAVEDAGIAPMEAMACGRPALVLAEGGARESLVEGETGLVFERGGPQAIADAVDRAETLSFNTGRIRAHAERFSKSEFERRFAEFEEEALRRHSRSLEPSASPPRAPEPPT